MFIILYIFSFLFLTENNLQHAFFFFLFSRFEIVFPLHSNIFLLFFFFFSYSNFGTSGQYNPPKTS